RIASEALVPGEPRLARGEGRIGSEGRMGQMETEVAQRLAGHLARADPGLGAVREEGAERDALPAVLDDRQELGEGRRQDARARPDAFARREPPQGVAERPNDVLQVADREAGLAVVRSRSEGRMALAASGIAAGDRWTSRA